MPAPKRRRQFTREFKQDVVRMIIEDNHKVGDVARDFEIDRTLISRWIREYRDHNDAAFPGNGKPLDADEELRQLRRDLARVKMERDILKKAISIFSGPEK